VEESRVYAVKICVSSIEQAADVLLAAGQGIDMEIVDVDVERVSRLGMRSVLASASEALLATTLHLRSHLLLNPPARAPHLPILPHPDMESTLTEVQQAARALHFLVAVCAGEAIEVEQGQLTAETVELLSPFAPGQTIDERLHLLADGGGRFLLSPIKE
jgi:hypothetical protein